LIPGSGTAFTATGGFGYTYWCYIQTVSIRFSTGTKSNAYGKANQNR